MRASYLKQYDCQLLRENTSHEELVSLEKTLPSDTYLVRYIDKRDDEERCSAIRAYKSPDIFDALHDAGHKVLEIKLGYGLIKPKLYTPEED